MGWGGGCRRKKRGQRKTTGKNCRMDQWEKSVGNFLKVGWTDQWEEENGLGIEE